MLSSDCTYSSNFRGLSWYGGLHSMRKGSALERDKSIGSRTNLEVQSESKSEEQELSSKQQHLLKGEVKC